ncbi:MAG: hypothetical protein ACOC3Z_03075 [Nanoarchaeota archaeon]
MIELILWIIATIIVIEIAFICFLIDEKRNSHIGLQEEWYMIKVKAIFIGICIMISQAFLVFGKSLQETPCCKNGDYIYLFYEFLVILVLALFFLLNYSISKLINNKNA